MAACTSMQGWLVPVSPYKGPTAHDVTEPAGTKGPPPTSDTTAAATIIVEGHGDTAEGAMADLANQLCAVRPDPNGGAISRSGSRSPIEPDVCQQ